MTKKLIALDMDGTLLTSHKEIPTENLQAIADAQKAGHLVMICSGRPYESLNDFLKEQGLGNLPVSANNGALTIVDSQVIHQVFMTPDTIKQAVAWLNENEYPFNIYTDQGVFCPTAVLDRADKALLKAPPRTDEYFINVALLESYLAHNGAIYFDTYEELPVDLNVFKFYVFTPEAAKKQEMAKFAKSLTDVSVTSSYPDNIEFSHLLGHKGTGVTAVANHFNIQMENTIAIGDNFNDEGMFDVAGLSVAMGNGEADIKKRADVVTLTNDECGVAYAIREYVLK